MVGDWLSQHGIVIILALSWMILLTFAVYEKSRWRIKPPRCRRKSDDTLWTPAGDTQHPFHGFNFVRLRKARWGWYLDYQDRWVFYDAAQFSLLDPGAG